MNPKYPSPLTRTIEALGNAREGSAWTCANTCSILERSREDACDHRSRVETTAFKVERLRIISRRAEDAKVSEALEEPSKRVDHCLARYRSEEAWIPLGPRGVDTRVR
ncbi:hypothetical protein FS749_008109, partial [Ceratobasidium sp. UAMH 11750]